MRLFLLALPLSLALMAIGCGESQGEKLRNNSVETRDETLARAEAKYPQPPTENFPMRGVLWEYTKRTDLLNHPWYTYILNDLGEYTHYFVSTTVPVNNCAFLGSTEDVVTKHEGTIVLTAPSLDGLFYGGSGAAAACNGWIFIDAGTGVMGLAFGTKILTFDAPLLLDNQPLRIQPVP